MFCRHLRKRAGLISRHFEDGLAALAIDKHIAGNG